MVEQKRSWVPFLLMAIIIPIGLFTGLRLAGMGQSPHIETITLNPISWQFNRTHISDSVKIAKSLNATYTDSSSQMSFEVYLGTYISPDVVPFSLQVLPSFSAMPLSNGFTVKEVVFSFGKDVNPSLVDLGAPDARGESVTLVCDNLSSVAFSSGQVAYYQLAGNHPSVGVNCQFLTYWYLSFNNSDTFSREITCSVTYYNGTEYNKVVQPFDLTLFGDSQ